MTSDIAALNAVVVPSRCVGRVAQFRHYVSTFDIISAMLTSTFGPNGFFLSPHWFVLEGPAFGLLIDYVATKFGGEGKQTMHDQSES